MLNIWKSIASMIDVSKLKFQKKEEKPSIIKDVLSEPDLFKLEAFVENGEIVIKIKKREELES